MNRIKGTGPDADGRAGALHTGRNVTLLCLALGLSNTGAVMVMTVTALTGAMLTRPDVMYWLPLLGAFPETALATLALGVQFLGTMATTVPASFFMGRFGRRAGFLLGQVIGAVGAGLSAFAIMQQSFWLFVCGGFLLGAHNAFWQYYRFAAADTASEEFRPKAISIVMVGPVVAGFLGPELAKLGRPMFEPSLFAGSYMLMILLAFAAMALLVFLRIPQATGRDGPGGDGARPLKQVAAQPAFLFAVFAGMVGYSGMSFLMTATPLAMIAHQHDFNDAAFVIQWHVVAMFAPGFVTGFLIGRFGAPAVIRTGALMYLVAVAVAMTGTATLHFLAALMLVGVGWNFLYVGGTALLTLTYRPAEKSRAQGLNDFCVSGGVAFASLMSGALQNFYGWQTINLLILVPVLAVLTASLFVHRPIPKPASG